MTTDDLPEETYQTLVVLLDCHGVEHLDTGELRAVTGPHERVSLPDGAIDALVERGWVELTDLPDHRVSLVVTGAGRMHGLRWLKRYERQRRAGR